MTKPLFSLIYTSARSVPIRMRTGECWDARAFDSKRLEWCVTSDDEEELEFTVGRIHHKNLTQPPFNSVRGWNAAAAMSTGQVLVMVADDLVPPMNWDEELLRLTDNGPEWIHGEWLVEVNDGIRTDGLICHPIMTRPYYQKLGWIFPPYYQSMFPDNELTELARRDGKVINARHLTFEHQHWVNGRREKDDVDKAQSGQERYEQDRAVFERRKAAGFPDSRKGDTQHEQ